MSLNRNYQSGTEKALFLLSRGYCYEPKCRRRVMLKSAEGEPRVNVQIAHIEGLNEGSARYNPNAQDVNSFKNLILLCKPHHDEVDGESTRHKFPPSLLRDWKSAREGDLMDELEDLDWLTQDRLQTLMSNALASTGELIDGVISDVASVSADTAEILRLLVNESFNRPYLDSESVASLERSAHSLKHLPETSEMLMYSSRDLRELPDYAVLLMESSDAFKQIALKAQTLYEAAEMLQNFGTNVQVFSLAAQAVERSRLNEAFDRVDGMGNVAQSIREATAGASGLSGIAGEYAGATRDLAYAIQTARLGPRDRARYFVWGAGIGIFVSIVILALCAYVLSHR